MINVNKYISLLLLQMFSRQYILILKDINVRQILTVEETMESNLREGMEKETMVEIYNKIPTVFKSLNDWPLETNLLCWFCNRSFTNRPYFFPEKLLPCGDDCVEFTPKGNYCSANCVAASIDTKVVDIKDRSSIRQNWYRLLFYEVKIFTGQDVTKIRPALSPHEMIKYGGRLTEEEYNKHMDDINIAVIEDKIHKVPKTDTDNEENMHINHSKFAGKIKLTDLL